MATSGQGFSAWVCRSRLSACPPAPGSYNPMLALDSLAHYSQDRSNPGPEINEKAFRQVWGERQSISFGLTKAPLGRAGHPFIPN